MGLLRYACSMNTNRLARVLLSLTMVVVCATAVFPGRADAQTAEESKLIESAQVVKSFTANERDAIPTALLQRAHGIAVIPNMIRGGFILGGRRGKGVLVVRSDNGEWSNPAFVNLTGGSIGWQIGAESADMVLVFANDRSVANIATGKFTLGGDASAVAGPLGRHATMAITFKAEVYGYLRSRGLFAGATFEGVRLKVDDDRSRRYYATDAAAQALGVQNSATPASARRFLLTLEQAARERGPLRDDTGSAEEAVTFPLE